MNNFKSSVFLFKKLLTNRPIPRLILKPRTSKLFTSALPRAFSTTAYTAKPDKEAHNPFSALITRSDASLSSALEWDETIRDVEERFHLSQIHDVKKVFSILRQANYKYPLNDLVHFLRRIVEISDEKHLMINTHNSVELSSFINEIKTSLKQGKQEYPLIGSYAWCFWKLHHQEDPELWLTLGDHIIDGRFHPNFNESMCGIEGFTALDGIADQQFIDEVYKKLERVLILTVLEVNITHYKRLTESLVKVHRFSDYVFENLEQHLLHFIDSHSLEYDLKLMLDILSCFAVSGNGSEHLFYAFQDIFKNFYTLESDQQRELLRGEFISKLVQTYALAKMRHAGLVYDQNFSKLVNELVVGNEAHYTLEELLNVAQHINMFEFENIKEINELLDSRLFEVKGHMKGDDMVRYIDLKVLRDHEEDYSKLPAPVMAFFDDYLNKNMEKQEHNQIFYYISEVENRKLMKAKNELMNHLVMYVSSRLHVYDFEDLCYFYWLFNKYFTMIKSDDPKIQCGLSQIKDHIRLYSAFSKGRLQIGSNFYKMLEVVSGSDFLSQGEYPEW